MSRFFAFLSALILINANAEAARISDVSNTVHNLSKDWSGTGADPRDVKAVSEQRICVFCHTPHHANAVPQAPLWNRQLAGDPGYSVSYSMYDTASMDANRIAGVPTAPSNSSKLCLSCHDGTIAVGSVNVLNSRTNQTISMNGGVTTMPYGTLAGGNSAQNTGNTRNLGIDLTNDHPISISYDSALVTADGELTDPTASPHIGVRGPGVKPLIPLIPDPQDGNKPKLECVSCHDPHIRDDSGADIKFLRLNRFQTAAPVPLDASGLLVNFNQANDIICLACHNKDGWVNSAHASPTVANEIYTDAAAAARDFPTNIQVWQAACLNCHDTHTVAGSRRLLREGTDALRVSGEQLKQGGGYPAIEETCYQCHSSDGGTLKSQGINTEVPDIKTDFQSFRRMPITSAEQPAGFEVHNIGNTSQNGDGKDFIESQETLGKGAGNLINRHVECTDCHNPHRVIKNNLASDNPNYEDASGTHQHTGAIHNNLISGVLRGSWGVEPVYTSNSFHSSPTTFNVKRGVPTMGASMALEPDSYSYVTREYQICLKCHSNYGFDDTDLPALGSFTGGTPIGTNGLTHYTNQAKEFQAPASHKGEPLSVGWDGGACNTQTSMNTNNHRSWHPVMDNTGRDAISRGNMSADAFLPPWNVGIGSQTMYCSDCHGSDTAIGTVEPNDGVNGNPWGPHGSTNNFILKVAGLIMRLED